MNQAPYGTKPGMGKRKERAGTEVAREKTGFAKSGEMGNGKLARTPVAVISLPKSAAAQEKCCFGMDTERAAIAGALRPLFYPLSDCNHSS